MIGDYLILIFMAFVAGLFFGRLAENRPRARLAEIKALLRRQNAELAQLDAGAQAQATSSAWVDVYVLVAPTEDE